MPLLGGSSRSLSPQLEAVSAITARWFRATASEQMACVGPPWALDCVPAVGSPHNRVLPVPTALLAWDTLIIDQTLRAAWVRPDGTVDVGFADGRPCLALPGESGVAISCLR
jgi:hypothetical protein